MEETIPVHIIGGFGDVTVGRKLGFLLLNPQISSKLGLISILDRYPQTNEIASNPRNFLEKTVRPNFKTPVKDEVIDALAEKIKAGLIRYYFCGEAGEGTSDFFKETRAGDVVDISTPNLSHMGYLKRAIEETLAHVIIEKPVVARSEEVERARKLIRESHKQNPQRILVDAEHYSHNNLIKYYLDNIPQNIAELGKIKNIKIELREQEGFESQRNKNVINKEISGGGIWLDLGPHVLSFLTYLGAQTNPSSIRAQRYKYLDASIADPHYQETRMETSFDVNGNHFTENGAHVEISAGKASGSTRKTFRIEHEKGYVDIDLVKKSYISSGGKTHSIQIQDPFFNSYMDLINSIKNGQPPRTPIEKSLDTLTNLFAIQEVSHTHEIESYTNWN